MNFFRNKIKSDPFNQLANAEIEARFGNRLSSSQLKENLVIAAQINLHVQKTIPFVFNDYERCKQTFPRIETIADEELNEIYTVRKNLVERFQTFKGTDLDRILKCADEVEKFGMSNCDGLACAGFKFALTHFPHANVEIFEIADGDHFFLVIGRKKRSPPHKFIDWGCNTVVCDPWALKYYLASEIPTHLEDLATCVGHNGKLQAIKKPFDPSKQVLALVQSKPDSKKAHLSKVLIFMAAFVFLAIAGFL
ncbi:MAG TPA: hypothetical protein VLG76_04905 [Rhabdochlamydiaceae bacterium]|nr:hypothetical protein [Rhabdochlamydiaceae bacterium]